MIIFAVIKASGIRTSVESFNLVWELFWQQVEACAAVIMVSFTAFRSIFISNKQKVDKANVRPGIFQRFQTWLSSKKVSRGDAKHLSPSVSVDQAPPHVTLGTPFQSIQRKGLLGSQVQLESQSVSFSPSQDPENSLHEEPQDSENLVRQHRVTGVSAVSDSGSWEHQPGKDPVSCSSSQGMSRSHRGHWWQTSIISNFTLSRTKGPDSEV